MSETSRRRFRLSSRATLILVLVCFFGPASIAWTLFFSGWVPGSTSNHGSLLKPPHRLQAPLLDETGAPLSDSELRGRWSMLLVSNGACDDLCLDRLSALRQVRLALAQNMDRARVVLVLPAGTEAPSEVLAADDDVMAVYWTDQPAFPEGDPARDAALSLSLVDTRGYRMMRYDEPFAPSGMLADMKKLLKISNLDLERLQGLSEDD